MNKDMFNFNKPDGKELPIQTESVNTDKNTNTSIKTSDEVNITVIVGDQESTFVITKEDLNIIVNSHELVVRKDFSTDVKLYRIIGIGDSMLVTELELDYFYSNFKELNN